MHPRDICRLNAFCLVLLLLSTLLCISAAVISSTKDGRQTESSSHNKLSVMPTKSGKEANLSAAIELGKDSQSARATTLDYSENGTLEIAANKSVSLEDDFEEEDEEKDTLEGEEDTNEDGDQIYSENYLDNYDEDNGEHEEENGEVDDGEDNV